jgi:hypothetical protein
MRALVHVLVIGALVHGLGLRLGLLPDWVMIRRLYVAFERHRNLPPARGDHAQHAAGAPQDLDGRLRDDDEPLERAEVGERRVERVQITLVDGVLEVADQLERQPADARGVDGGQLVEVEPASRYGSDPVVRGKLDHH